MFIDSFVRVMFHSQLVYSFVSVRLEPSIDWVHVSQPRGFPVAGSDVFAAKLRDSAMLFRHVQRQGLDAVAHPHYLVLPGRLKVFHHGFPVVGELDGGSPNLVLAGKRPEPKGFCSL